MCDWLCLRLGMEQLTVNRVYKLSRMISWSLRCSQPLKTLPVSVFQPLLYRMHATDALSSLYFTDFCVSGQRFSEVFYLVFIARCWNDYRSSLLQRKASSTLAYEWPRELSALVAKSWHEFLLLHLKTDIGAFCALLSSKMARYKNRERKSKSRLRSRLESWRLMKRNKRRDKCRDITGFCLMDRRGLKDCSMMF